MDKEPKPRLTYKKFLSHSALATLLMLGGPTPRVNSQESNQSDVVRSNTVVTRVGNPESVFQWWEGSRRAPIRDRINFIFLHGLGNLKSDGLFEKIEEVLINKGYERDDFYYLSWKADQKAPYGGVYTREDTTKNLNDTLVGFNNQVNHLKSKVSKSFIFGFSGGSYLGHELLKLHPNFFKGFISFNGAIAGAGLNFIELPHPISSTAARIALGEAGQFLVAMGQNPGIKNIKEIEVIRFQEQGIDYSTFYSTDDKYLKRAHAYIENSKTQYLGQTVDLIFPMGRFIQNQIQEYKTEGVDDLKLDFDYPEAEPSASLTDEEYIGSHFAPLHHPKVLASLEVIIPSR